MDEQKKVFDAQPHYERAVEAARGMGRPKDEAMLCMLLARNLGRQGKHAKAQERCEEALKILGDRAGQSREAALIHSDLARSLDAQGKGDEARGHYERALSLLESIEGPTHPDTAVAHLNYAQYLHKQNQWGPARAHFDAALRKLGGAAATAQPREAIACYLGSATNLMALGRYGEARRHAKEAGALATQHPGADQLQMIAIARTLQVSGLMGLVLPGLAWGIVLAIVLGIAWHAGKCGYPPLLWIATGLLSGLPMANLAVLAALPDLRLEKERAKLRRQLLHSVASAHGSRP
jgi:tetratricopeptide (TPR) repeat protein